MSHGTSALSALKAEGGSERLQKRDQRLLIGVTEVGTEVMAAVDDIIRTFAQREELLSYIREYLTRLLVRGAGRQCFQVAHQLHYRFYDRFVVSQPIG